MAGRKVRQKHEWIGRVSPFGDSGVSLQPGLAGRLEAAQTGEWVRRVDVGRNPE